METTIVFGVYIGCLRFRVSRFRAYHTLQCSSFWGLVFFLVRTLIRTTKKRYYIAGSR